MDISHNLKKIQITFNNPLKVSVSKIKYLITIQTRPTQIVKVYFLSKSTILLHIKSEQKIIRK